MALAAACGAGGPSSHEAALDATASDAGSPEDGGSQDALHPDPSSDASARDGDGGEASCPLLDASEMTWGALDGGSAPAPPDAVIVEPGAPIQPALDRAAGTGQWVVLAAGTHRITDALQLPSGVTLAGQGKQSVLTYAVFPHDRPDASSVVAVVANTDEHIHDVVVRDLVIDCGASDMDLRDPSAPPMSGVYLVSTTAPDMSKITLDHVSVAHCTEMGVHVKGARDLTIDSCDLSNNGGAGAPNFYHNLYIRRITHGIVRNSRLDDSPFGNGLNISYSVDVTASCNEASGNGFRGARVAETNTVAFLNNVTEHNVDCGLVANAEDAGCQNVTIQGNISRFNANYGLELRKITGLVMKDNLLSPNDRGDVDGP